MGDRQASSYWCYVCSQTVNPTTDPEIKCPLCDSGFVEEMAGIRNHSNTNTNAIDSGSVNNLSLWAPILLGLIGGLSPSSQLRIASRDQINGTNSQDWLEDDELGRESESSVPRRTTRGSTSAVRMLRDMRTMAASDSENSENGRDRSGRMILFDPINEEALVVQGSFDVNRCRNPSHRPASSFGGDHIRGSGWDILLQYLSENDPNRYGTLPAQKEAVEAMPTITVEENSQCPVCLEEFEIGNEAKEMPCKHKFHVGCIIPWLELHSSCPVCRFQLPLDDSKIEPNGDSSSAQSSGRVGSGRRYWIPIPWPYDGLGTLSGSQSESTSAPSSETIPGNENAAQRDAN
ncbi:Vacuolar ATP synthase catalytic subunit-related / V-ATPase-related / vacuolar proton pump-related [Hibiscus syriacus]|uniref:RING-type E3 ubiquitin transferase n=1 Tax=Hibiscus syriacus TaxID=106335 RepID=A0A6A3B7U4_HIBSY|nr:E3 ubiquitin-protein ligase SIRP1-like [Hibiscus syriacus]KAE8713284.1 Vacuolar ATP synthase catalytic subunit-related / V-ATPase-related / vacuolar proton pump-related [Hibiscus syriacus]